MKLLGDRILFLPMEKKSNSLIIDPSAKDNDGAVVLVGENVQKLKIGDKVRKFNASQGIPIEYNKMKCLMLRENGDIEMVL